MLAYNDQVRLLTLTVEVELRRIEAVVQSHYTPHQPRSLLGRYFRSLLLWLHS
jgi:hypothetical protein